MSKLLLILLAVLVLSGCGYHVVGDRDFLQGANGVNVILFVNRSYRSGVEGVLGRQIVDEFAQRSGGKVLPGDKADLELVGVILSYATIPVSYTANDVIREYQASLKVEATLRQRTSQKVLWKGEVTETQVYPANIPPQNATTTATPVQQNAGTIPLQQNAESAAVERICRRIAEDIWTKAGERF
ncbi:LPS assembly lipoprotein LptE [Geomesophilobacter sediminis]|uniref:LptE family protein n=1 Tax=Geomesophilobacter sediminis TaxID=2798584 RepID=A0A8J7M2V8_9BACT|nr:LptE family protein [Geomesophilobacter sediminis]MBJ6727733.1 LptE family protein [Geomesophilobacter sediminis]